MQVQQTDKGCPNRALDSHDAASSLSSAYLYKGEKRRILQRVPNNLHYDMSATYYNNGHLQFLGMSNALDLL